MNEMIEVNEILRAMTRLYDESLILSDEERLTVLVTLNMLARTLKLKPDFDALKPIEIFK